MPLIVHLLDEPAPASLHRLLARLDPEIELSAGRTPGRGRECEVLVAGRPTRRELEACPALRLLVIPFAGLPDVTARLLADLPHLAVHNLHHNAAPTAEFAVALMLAAAKLLVPIDRRFRADDWSDRYAAERDLVLDGKTALIIGYGAIGRRVARVCLALNMSVLAVRRRPEAGTDPGIEVYGPGALRDLLPRANVLVLALPSTPQTVGLIGRAELELLPERAVVVNVGRAASIDERALYEALVSRRLLAAGLDAWYRYPESRDQARAVAPAHLPFHYLDNVVMSPHRAGGLGVRDVEDARMDALADLLNAAARGQTIPNRVDLKAGY